MFILNQAKKAHLETCLNNAVEKGFTKIDDIKKEATKAFKERYDSIDFLIKQEVFKNYFA